MPLLNNSFYKAPVGFRNPHIQSIYPQLCRQVKGITYIRERIATPDNDFLDLDWCNLQSNRCAILLHGLEGHTRRSYMQGMARTVQAYGWNAVAMSFRGCSGEPNKTLRMYHHGVSDDLHTVIMHVLNRGYDEIALIGFSLGGNVILKYLGEGIFTIPDQLKCSVAISAPCDLAGCAVKIDRERRSFYRSRFLKMLHKKLVDKKTSFPDAINIDGFKSITTFREYDNRYTAPFHGFRDADDYYTRNASLQFLETIKTPVLLINAQDDPFLTKSCFPTEVAQKSTFLYLEAPEHGGHVGFIKFDKTGHYWHEQRTSEFLQKFTK
jgi:predicted alpha/beta-fold hydrolase